MGKHFQRDLYRLQHDLLALAGLVEETIGRAVRALQNRDVPLAQEVIAGDAQIDREENQLHEVCIDLLARYQPVAVDLRRVVAVLRITTDLERMGDLAEEIAERTQVLARSPQLPIPRRLERMAELAARMVRQSLDAFVELDRARATAVLQLDDEVDRYNRELIDEIVRLMQGDPALVEPGLSLFSATRHLERIADHATNIAEDVLYLIEGEIVRHRPASGPVRQLPRGNGS